MKRITFRMKTTKDTRKECDRRDQMWQPYFQGQTPAHFPVPAIPHIVDITPNFICICEMNDPQYTYGAITLYPHS